MTLTDDRAKIIELFGHYADIADTKNFDELPSLVHADPFTTDFQSLTGLLPMTTALAGYVQVLRGSFDRFVATHHAITGRVITITGDRAIAHAHVRAEHWMPAEAAGRGPNRWLVAGFYENEAIRTEQGWRFSAVTLRVSYQENAHLLTDASRN